MAGELRQIDLDDLPGGDVEQLAVRGRGLRHQLHQEDPLMRMTIVVDDVFTVFTKLLGAAASQP